MSRAIAVLRPEPGNRVTAAAIEARGRRAIRLPLFEVVPVEWVSPDPARFDALIVTSANAVRHGGVGLAALRALPVHAVGSVTAEAARRAGFEVAHVGSDGAAALLVEADAKGVRRALHLAGRERTIEAGGIVAEIATVYASEPVEIGASDAAKLAGTVAMLYSARAAARLAELVDSNGIDRATIALAAISEAVRDAAGRGWQKAAVSSAPGPDALIELAVSLAD